MAFDPSPTGYFPNINPSGEIAGVTGVFIPYSDLESYDYDVVVSNTGDIRQFMYSIMEAFSDEFYSLATDNRSTNLTVSRSSSVPSDTTIRKVYSFTVNLELGPTSVLPE